MTNNIQVKVKTSRFSYNGNVYTTGNVLTVDNDLGAIRTLIQMKDLELTNAKTKEEFVDVLVDPEDMTKAELIEYADASGFKISKSKSKTAILEEITSQIEPSELEFDDPEDGELAE